MAILLSRILVLYFILILLEIESRHPVSLPLIINTWDFYAANVEAWDALHSKKMTALESLVAGGSQCDLHRKCGESVGYGGHPDESGETTLDAMVMDGVTHSVGAVGDLRYIRAAMSVAYSVMLYTYHTILVGQSATKFAMEMGYKLQDLQTKQSYLVWKRWKEANCQPNYRKNVTPDPRKSCGPYKADREPRGNRRDARRHSSHVSTRNHDTIGIIIVDERGDIVAGTTTNGMEFKVPGRVSDSPLVGAGAYVDNNVGAAVATGDGDVMMRFLPSYQAVAYMEQGFSPESAAKMAIMKIVKYYTRFSGALIAVNKTGHYGASCYGFGIFPYLVRNVAMENTTRFTVTC